LDEQVIFLKENSGIFENNVEEGGWLFFNGFGNFSRETETRFQYSESVLTEE